MTSGGSGYVLAPDAEEIRRLHAQAHIYDRSTNPLLARFVRPGMNCIELGCGLGSSTQTIAEAVGRTGRVTALDQSDLYLDYTRRRLEYAGDDGIDYVRATVETYRFPRDLDLVFGRAVLHHVHDAPAAFGRVADGLRPGGLAIFQEPDIDAILSDPIGPAQKQLWGWYCAMGRREGLDFGVGDRLARMATHNGLVVLEVAAFQPFLAAAAEKAILSGLLHTIGPQLVERGIASGGEIADCAAMLGREVRDGGTYPYLTFVHVVAMKPFDGRRPHPDWRPLEMV